MMKRFAILLFIFIISTIFLSSCTSDGDDDSEDDNKGFKENPEAPKYTPSQFEELSFKSGRLIFSEEVAQFSKGSDIAFRYVKDGAGEDDYETEQYGYLTLTSIADDKIVFSYAYFDADHHTVLANYIDVELDKDAAGLDINEDSEPDLRWVSAESSRNLTSESYLEFSLTPFETEEDFRHRWSFSVISQENTTDQGQGILAFKHDGSGVFDDWNMTQSKEFDSDSGTVTYQADQIVSLIKPGDYLFVSKAVVTTDEVDTYDRTFRKVTAVLDQKSGSKQITTQSAGDPDLYDLFELLSKIKFTQPFPIHTGVLAKKEVSLPGQTLSIQSDSLTVILTVSADIESEWVLEEIPLKFKSFSATVEITVDGDTTIGMDYGTSLTNNLSLGLPLCEPILIPDTPILVNPVAVSVKIDGEFESFNIEVHDQLNNLLGTVTMDGLAKNHLVGTSTGKVKTESVDVEKGSLFGSITPSIGFSTSVSLAELISFDYKSAGAFQIENYHPGYAVRVTPEAVVSAGVDAEIDSIISFSLADAELYSYPFPIQYYNY